MSDDLATRKRIAYHAILCVIESLDLEEQIQTVYDVDSPVPQIGMTREIPVSVISFRPRVTENDGTYADILRVVAENSTMLKTLLASAGIDSELIDSRGEGQGRDTRLFVDIEQHNFDTSLRNLLFLNKEKIKAAAAVSLTGVTDIALVPGADGKAFAPEPTAEVLASMILQLQETAKTLGIDKSVAALTSPRGGRSLEQ